MFAWVFSSVFRLVLRVCVSRIACARAEAAVPCLGLGVAHGGPPGQDCTTSTGPDTLPRELETHCRSHDDAEQPCLTHTLHVASGGCCAGASGELSASDWCAVLTIRSDGR